MENNVVLTDDELALVATAIQVCLLNQQALTKDDGEESINEETNNVIRKMKTLLHRLDKENFGGKIINRLGREYFE